MTTDKGYSNAHTVPALTTFQKQERQRLKREREVERELHEFITQIVLNWGPEREEGAARRVAALIIREVRKADA